ncbi:GPI transamidase component Gpi17p [Trichomonascus vanleenenianus]|uniref:GPI-anchor transamidase GPI17 n=1 Tax=Trichomonascus vanleenenianus TaxID=2268995 RepID=UPI003ECAA4E7
MAEKAEKAEKTEAEKPKKVEENNGTQRRWVVLCFLAMAVLLGVPMWLYTTSIYRAPLNYKVMDFYDKHISEAARVNVPVYLNVGPEFPDLVEAAQYQIDQELHEMGVDNWWLELHKGQAPQGQHVTLNFRLGDDNEYLVSETGRDIMVTYALDIVAVGSVPDLVTGVLLDHVFSEEIELVKSSEQGSMVVGYSPMYHLTFSLLSGDGEPIGWDIGEALSEHFTSFREELSRVANVTVDTQIEYFAKMTTDPQPVPEGGFELDSEHLSTFVNFAEWGLTSIHSYPTLHFIIYVPSMEQSPLRVKNSSSNSFAIPQWGGIVIKDRPKGSHFNSQDLLPVLETFASQLLELLGAPSKPESPKLRLDFLSRVSTLRALKSASSTLGSLERLSKSLPNIAIPKPVLTGVDGAIEAIKDSLDALSRGEWHRAITGAGVALQKSESAFFDKMMVQQMYFPEEHKVAIYLPLLGPVAVVLVLGLARVVKESKQSKQGDNMSN